MKTLALMCLASVASVAFAPPDMTAFGGRNKTTDQLGDDINSLAKLLGDALARIETLEKGVLSYGENLTAYDARFDEYGNRFADLEGRQSNAQETGSRSETEVVLKAWLQIVLEKYYNGDKPVVVKVADGTRVVQTIDGRVITSAPTVETVDLPKDGNAFV